MIDIGIAERIEEKSNEEFYRELDRKPLIDILVALMVINDIFKPNWHD